MKLRVQITISPVLMDWAKRLMELRGFDSFSALVEDLVRAEYERRQTCAAPLAAARLNDPTAAASAPSAPVPPATPVRYRKPAVPRAAR